MSDVNGQLADRVVVNVPRYGLWRASVWLSSGTAPTGSVTLTVGGLEFVGTVDGGGEDTADRPSLTIVGGLGWEAPLADPMSYQSPAGVQLSTVLRDLATRAGEPIELPADRSLGSNFEALPSLGQQLLLRDVLDGLRRTGKLGPWRVDPDGVMRFGERTGVEVASRATEMRRNAALGMRVLGIDKAAPFMPGNTVDGATIDRVTIHDDTDLRAVVWTAKRSIRSSIQRMLAEQLERIELSYPRTYKVAAVRADGSLDLVPPTDAPRLPELSAVEPWTLGRVTPAVDSEVLVVFRDADPTRPIVVGWAFGSTPVDLEIGASASLFLDGGASARLDATKVVLGDPLLIIPPAGGPAARVGDSVALPTITTGSAKVQIQ